MSTDDSSIAMCCFVEPLFPLLAEVPLVLGHELMQGMWVWDLSTQCWPYSRSYWPHGV